MTNKRKKLGIRPVGKAYAFFDYNGGMLWLFELMLSSRDKANFPDTPEFTVLDDRKSSRYVPERKGLPAKIAQVAEVTDVYGSVSIDKIGDLPEIPKKAANLRYLVMARDPEARDSEFVGPLGETRANQVTARKLNEVLRLVGDAECHSGFSKFLRAAVFYQDSRRRVQRYIG